MPGSGSSRPEPLLLYLVKQVELAARARLDDIVRPTGLTALQYTALTVLERNDDMTSAALARNSFVTAQSMADMVAILEDRGFIERRRDAADRRRLLVVLTPAGQALLDRCRAEVTRLESCMVSGLSASEVAGLRRALRACHRNLAQSAALM
jgi:DNA-binding MarR family transcriptional regulator